MVHGPKPPSQKIRWSRVVREVKGLALSWRSKTRFDSMPRSLFCNTLRSFRRTAHDEAHFWLNDYVNKQSCRIWSEANPQVYVETPLHPEKLTVWCALWAGGILLQKR
ncbi:hypothetical protein TNCV_329021 [Trichonephila clavipes]|nr:hypothetical protein TNCV_329021 [Trichonephila clavipes]